MSNNNSLNSGWITFTYSPNSGNWTMVPDLEPVAKAAKPKDKDGCDCKKCKEFYPYAEPNQDDGTLICYSCRTGW